MVKITLHSGHNLAVRDRSGQQDLVSIVSCSVHVRDIILILSIGTSDPYVKIKHMNYKTRSSIVYRNLNPIWNEKFGFKVRELSRPIRFKVYDKDSVTADDFMGYGVVSLDNGVIGRYVNGRDR